jgi:hypothetical protein
MRPALKTVTSAGILLLGGLAGLAFIAPAGALAQRPIGPRFIYGPGSQGFGYYASPGPQTVSPSATVPRPSSASRTGGGGSRPRNRDWTTGHRMRNHKPWLRPMD